MPEYISMLRGINVSGQKSIRMAELKAVYEALPLTQVETYVQSGNVLFASDEADPVVLERELKARILQTFGHDVEVLIRTAAEFQAIIAANPFLNGRQEDSERLYVTFLAQPPAEALLGKLGVSPESTDEFVVSDCEIYLFCPGGYGVTKLSNNFFERKLKVPATTRNWKTVTKLAEMAQRLAISQKKLSDFFRESPLSDGEIDLSRDNKGS